MVVVPKRASCAALMHGAQLSARSSASLVRSAISRYANTLALKGGAGTEGAKQMLLRGAVRSYLNACYSESTGRTNEVSSSAVVKLTSAALNTDKRSAMVSQAGRFDAINAKTPKRADW